MDGLCGFQRGLWNGEVPGMTPNEHQYLPTSRRRSHAPSATSRRRGVTQVEVIVAAGLVVASLTFLPRIGYQLQRITKESKQYQIAIHELANHLERLTRNDPQPLEEALSQSTLAPYVIESLDGAKLDGRVIEDALGTRIELSLQWKRSGDPPPVKLVGWVSAEPVSPPLNSGGGS